jgi:outer membrane immunogenic protein
MRRLLFSSVSLLVLSAAGASAADIPRPMPAKAPAVYAPVFTWTGFYLGINGGYGWGTSDWDGFAADASPDGFLIGGTIGYNWQTGPWVFGLEGDVDWTNIKGSFTNILCPVGCETKVSWLATARGRLGYSFGNVMPYITGGLAVGEIKATAPFGFASVSETNAGWTVGGGIEAMLAPNWTVKAEYLYVDLGDVNCGVLACGVLTNVDFTAHLVRGGVNFKF